MSVKNIRVDPFQVNSLFVLCKDCIKVSLTKSNCATSHLDPVVVGSQMRINSPFLQLPPVVLEELIRSFTDSSSGKPVENNILVHLITPQLRNMRFAFYSEDCLRFFPYFEKLQVLVLKNTTADNCCLRSIGTHCAELRSLDVSRCFNLSNIGMHWLFINVDNFQMAGKPHRICNTFRHLNILHTRVSVCGIEKAFKYCPSLAILESDNTFEALVKLANKTTEKKINRQVNGYSSLRVLNIPCGMIYRSNSLRLVLPMCISIIHVTVHAIKGFRDCDLLSLKSIEKLTALKILRCTNSKVNDETEITFDGGVAPLLEVVGKSLEIFEIQLHLDSFQVSTLIEYCPHLVSLSIGEKCGTTLSLSNLKIFFCNYNMPSDFLLLLLSSPLLAHVQITECNSFTDCVLETAFQHKRLKNLKVMELAHCNSFSTQGIVTLLLNRRTSISKIKIVSCSNITSEMYPLIRYELIRRGILKK